jgi:hypothetical protein
MASNETAWRTGEQDEYPLLANLSITNGGNEENQPNIFVGYQLYSNGENDFDMETEITDKAPKEVGEDVLVFLTGVGFSDEVITDLQEGGVGVLEQGSENPARLAQIAATLRGLDG